MAWTASKWFVSFIEDALENTAALDLNTDTIKAALFTVVTPDNTAATAATLFAAVGSQWAAAGEVFDGAEWPTGGQALDGVTFAPTAAVLKLDADNEVSAGTSATLAAVHGCLVYDDAVADQGICYNWFGGAQQVTDGTFTIVWNAAGIATLTL